MYTFNFDFFINVLNSEILSRNLQTDTMRVIYSFTDDDPEDITGLDYHGSSNRGTKSVVLINYNDGNQTLPEDSISMDFLVTEVRIPRLFMQIIPVNSP